MDAVKQMRKDVKKYIDTADPKVVKMVHAMLEVESESNWLEDEQVLSILAERSTQYKTGKVKGVSWETAKKKIVAPKKNK
jgi:hypothetical protein